MSITAIHPSPTMTASRAVALEVGALVDVTPEARRLRFRHTVAVTRAVYMDSIHWDDLIEARKTGQTTEEPEGRLRDLLWHAYVAATRSRGSRTYFMLDRVPVDNRGTQARPVTLAMSIGPGDCYEPVITIGFPEEV